MKKIIFLAVLGLALFGGCAQEGKDHISFTSLKGGMYFEKALSGALVMNSAREFTALQEGRALRQPRLLEEFDFENNSLLVVFPAIGDKEGVSIKRIKDGEYLSVYAVKDGKPRTHYLKIGKTDKKAKLIVE